MYDCLDARPCVTVLTRAWHTDARIEGCTDRTVYGASSPTTCPCHLRLMSLAAAGATMAPAWRAAPRPPPTPRASRAKAKKSHVNAPHGSRVRAAVLTLHTFNADLKNSRDPWHTARLRALPGPVPS